MKKSLSFAVAVMSVGLAFAEDPAIDLTAATTSLTGITGAITTWLGTALPIITAFVGALFVVPLVKWVVGLVKSFLNRSK